MSTEKKKIPPQQFLALQVLTFARLPLSMAFSAVLVLTEHTWITLGICTVLLALNEITDLLDGYLARRFGIVTSWGSMFDPYADSVSRVIVYWGLAVSGLIHPLVPLCMAFRDASVSYSRIALTKCGRSVAAKKSGKIKAIIQGTAAFFALLGVVYRPLVPQAWSVPILSWIVGGATLLSMIEYVASAFKAVRESSID